MQGAAGISSPEREFDSLSDSWMNHGAMKAIIPTAHIHTSSIPDQDAERNNITPAAAQPQAFNFSFSKINPAITRKLTRRKPYREPYANQP